MNAFPSLPFPFRTGEFPMPELLAQQVAREPERRDWLARLPGFAAEIAERWSLQLGQPFQPGGQCSWVAPALSASRQRLAIKIGWVHPEAAAEADGLRFWDGNGAVRLHAAHQRDDTIALLLERCEPGTQLVRLPERDQEAVLCGILPRLWREPAAGYQFPALTDMCRQWADEFEAENVADPVQLDSGIVRAGIELFRLLPESADRQVLLATDLHAENILAAEREPWLAIDPKPHVGDPAYDPLQHMINCDGLVADPVGLARRLAESLELDPQRLLLWLFARCVQEVHGRPELAATAVRLAP
jgi:streptomycin 6-kinase